LGKHHRLEDLTEEYCEPRSVGSVGDGACIGIASNLARIDYSFDIHRDTRNLSCGIVLQTGGQYFGHSIGSVSDMSIQSS